MNLNLEQLKKKTIPVKQYIDSLKPPFSEKFLDRKQTYRLNQKAVNQLEQISKEYLAIAFSAEWCKDCATNIPLLALIAEATDLDVRVFGGLKKDPLSHTRKWRIPPSPPEVETFNIDKIPSIIIINSKGKEMGRIIENPKRAPTLEQELLEIIKNKQ